MLPNLSNKIVLNSDMSIEDHYLKDKKYRESIRLILNSSSLAISEYYDNIKLSCLNSDSNTRLPSSNKNKDI